MFLLEKIFRDVWSHVIMVCSV